MLQLENLRYYRLWLIIGGLLVLLIGYKSLEPIQIAMEGFDDVDLALHFLAYLVLTGWLQQIYVRQSHIPIAIAVALYSGALELTQGLILIREPNISDFLTNLGGIVLATALNRTALHDTLKSFEIKHMPA